MSFNFNIPKFDGSNLEISVMPGENLFVLGANGSGKSSIMHLFFSAYHQKARRISAHRQTWFSSNAITLSPEQKRNTENNIRGSDQSPQMRWKDDYSSQRASIAIYDLIDAENVRARSIAKAVDGSDLELAKILSKKDAPIKVINELLRLSNIPVEVSVKENEQVVASRNGGPHYSVAELSDGERNALLIAANVLTVAPETLVLIDEPERHLHRSITSPLLNQLFARRADCAFVISTHDVSLAVDNYVGSTLLLRDCRYDASTVKAWDADLIKNSSAIDDDLKRDILGSRRKILFIEGNDRSLDLQIYRIVFPGISIVLKASCRIVEQTVVGIRETGDLHWVHAFGIVDNDRRPAAEIEELRTKGVHAISEFSVESIYYHPEIQARVASRQVSLIGGNATDLFNDAKSAIFAAVSSHVQRLSERVAEKAIREEFFRHLPKKGDIAKGAPVSVTIETKKIVEKERHRLDEIIQKGDLQALIAFYPVRETPALADAIAKLRFKSREEYEGAVRKLISDDPDALKFVRSLFGSLSGELLK